MSSFLLVVVWNIVVAAALAVVAWVVSRVCRRPQLAHVLWVLVLVKLITPPLFDVPLPQFRGVHRAGSDARAAAVKGEAPLVPSRLAEGVRAELPRSASREVVEAGLPTGVAVPTTTVPPPLSTHRSEILQEPVEPRHASQPDYGSQGRLPATMPAAVREERTSASQPWWLAAVYIIWLVGAAAYAAALAKRYRTVRQLLRQSPGADAAVADAARQLAIRMGLAQCPSIRIVDARIPPLVWSFFWSPAIILPRSLLRDLDADQRDAVLAHELAHVRRRDHLVRWLEVMVLVPFWFNPLAWWARRELCRAEEECCDALVVWLLPASRRAYGRALLKTLEFLSPGGPAIAATGSAFGKPFFKRRIEMILKRDVRPTMSWRGWAAILLLTAVVVPAGAQTSGTDEPAAQGGDSARSGDSERALGLAEPAATVTEDGDFSVQGGPVDEVLSTGGSPSVSERAASSEEALARETAERARFAGGWKVAEIRHNGVPAPSQFEYYHWQFDAENSTAATAWKRGDGSAHRTEETRRFRFVINPDASPQELTIYGNNMLIQAIYKWEEDALVICFYGRSEKDRPRQFPEADGPRGESPLPVMEFKLVRDAAIEAASGSTLATVDEQTKEAVDSWRSVGPLDAVRQTEPASVARAAATEAEQSLRRLERLAERGFVSQSELARTRAGYERARHEAAHSALAREAEGQLLALDVAEAKVKLSAAENRLSSVQEAHRASAITNQEFEQAVYDVDLAKIELQRAEIKLKLHEQQRSVGQ